MTSADFSTLRILAAFLAVLLLVVFVCAMLLRKRNTTIAALPRSDRDAVFILFGTSLIDDGYEYFSDWSGCMLREFDDSIELNLEHYHAIAKSTAQHPRDQWPVVIQELLAE